MPAPRNCRSCGATLPADVRWCNQCSEAVREFSPRAPLHEGGHVGIPSHASAQRGGYTRWHATATTFGPGVRVGVSALYAFLVVYGFFQVFMLYWLIVVVVGGLIVKEIWNPGWRTVDPTPPSPSAPAEDVRIVAQGLRVPLPPERLEPDPPGPRTAGERAGLVLAIAGGVVVVAVFTWGTQEMKVATIMVGTMLGLYAYFRSFSV